MKIPAEWQNAHEFACYVASCAPPPAGRGGSLPGGGGVRKYRLGDKKFFTVKGAAKAEAATHPPVKKHLGRY